MNPYSVFVIVLVEVFGTMVAYHMTKRALKVETTKDMAVAIAINIFWPVLLVTTIFLAIFHEIARLVKRNKE